jgi:hypothetical protein
MTLVVISLLPAVTRDLWRTTPTRPAFFADEIYRSCFRPDETAFVPDAAGMEATLWQAESRYRFRLANGSLSPELPEDIPDREAAYSVLYNTVPEGGGDRVVSLARRLGATVVLIDAEHSDAWSPVFEQAGLEPVDTGGVRLYPLRPLLPACDR